ncbi:MAG: dUTP pyrophosphatase [Parcubacteria group bacterium Licking1014_17]|nr:MAG: dUTP pyrophosphatase [Parcubacteria group bacterium Licking1014_17]
MKIRIKRINKTIPLPEYKTSGAAAFDLAAREDTKIGARQTGLVPLNVVIETPRGHFLLIAVRSSLHKKGLMLANGIGIVDPDYSGDEDECLAAVYNFTNKPVVVKKGDRIAQGTFVKIGKASWKEVDLMKKKNRGGFGTTGGK